MRAFKLNDNVTFIGILEVPRQSERPLAANGDDEEMKMDDGNMYGGNDHDDFH